MKTIQVNTYSFAELDPKVQACVLDKFRHTLVEDSDWAECTLDCYKTDKATERCFEVKDILYSGFCSQGDGASWKGTVKVLPWLEKNQPDNPLLKYREAFEEYCTEIRVDQGGHYYHSNTMFLPEDDLGSVLDWIFEKENMPKDWFACQPVPQEIQRFQEMIKDLRVAILEDAKDFAQEIYTSLEQEYEYQTSDEAIKEHIEINEYEFFVDGRIV